MEINLKEKYLPIGTVVLLKGGKKRIMVTGFCVVAPEVEHKLFDYCGCIYPEGYINSTQNCLFNHDQIDKIYYVGLVDDEEMKFKKQLKEVTPLIDKEIQKMANNDSNEPASPAEPQPAPVAQSEVEAPAPAEPAVAEPVVAASEVAPQPVATETAQPAAAEPSVINFLDESQK